jgi:hypothetical protein
MKLRTSTALLAGLAGVSVWLGWADPWEASQDRAVLVSNRSAARRLFPGLGERSAANASFEFQSVNGERVRILPSPDGRHIVMRGETLLGPVDPDALGGIWSSLRMATTLRAVAPGSDIGDERGGIIRILMADQTLELALGREAPDGSGLYGVLRHEGDAAWVVEEELAWLVTQDAESWLSRRLSELDVDEIRGLAWGDALALERQDDELWRVARGDDPALLSSQAVDLRLDRLLHAELEPLIPRDALANPDAAARPWLFVNLNDGQTRTWVLGGECPGHPGRRVVDRGPGMLGCVDGKLVAPWNEGQVLAKQLLEGRLSPIAYGHVLNIELRGDARRMLRRRTGGWLLDDEERTHEVPDDEVYRWYQALSEAQFDIRAEALATDAYQPTWELFIASSAEHSLELRCGPVLVAGLSGKWACARGKAAPRLLAGELPRFDFDAASLADRRVMRFALADVRSLELGGSEALRQSIRQDLGVWRLDAPDHPEGDAALDQVRVENILGTLSSLRAEEWVGELRSEATREWRVHVSPGAGGDNELRIALQEGCLAQVEGGRAFRLNARSCEVLEGDMLFDDPLRHWLAVATSAQVRAAGEGSSLLFRRHGDGWRAADGSALSATWAERFVAWSELRTQGLRQGSTPSAAAFEVDFQLTEAAPVRLSVGEGWAALEGLGWWYALAPVVSGE